MHLNWSLSNSEVKGFLLSFTTNLSHLVMPILGTFSHKIPPAVSFLVASLDCVEQHRMLCHVVHQTPSGDDSLTDVVSWYLYPLDASVLTRTPVLSVSNGTPPNCSRFVMKTVDKIV